MYVRIFREDESESNGYSETGFAQPVQIDDLLYTPEEFHEVIMRETEQQAVRQDVKNACPKPDEGLDYWCICTNSPNRKGGLTLAPVKLFDEAVPASVLVEMMGFSWEGQKMNKPGGKVQERRWYNVFMVYKSPESGKKRPASPGSPPRFKKNTRPRSSRKTAGQNPSPSRSSIRSSSRGAKSEPPTKHQRRTIKTEPTIKQEPPLKAEPNVKSEPRLEVNSAQLTVRRLSSPARRKQKGDSVSDRVEFDDAFEYDLDSEQHLDGEQLIAKAKDKTVDRKAIDSVLKKSLSKVSDELELSKPYKPIEAALNNIPYRHTGPRTRLQRAKEDQSSKSDQSNAA
jgi:hypothetical protein